MWISSERTNPSEISHKTQLFITFQRVQYHYFWFNAAQYKSSSSRLFIDRLTGHAKGLAQHSFIWAALLLLTLFSSYLCFGMFIIVGEISITWNRSTRKMEIRAPKLNSNQTHHIHMAWTFQHWSSRTPTLQVPTVFTSSYWSCQAVRANMIAWMCAWRHRFRAYCLLCRDLGIILLSEIICSLTQHYEQKDQFKFSLKSFKVKYVTLWFLRHFACDNLNFLKMYLL